jgi:hypothetical protein
MKPSVSLAGIALILIAVTLVSAGTAYESSIYVVEKKNISMNVSDAFNVTNTGGSGNSVQSITINESVPGGKNASVLIMSMAFDSSSSQLNRSDMWGFIELMVNGIFMLAGDEVGNTTVKSAIGENVTLHSMRMNITKNESAVSTIGFWKLDDNTRAMIESKLDLNTTVGIVETLKIKE